MDYSGTSPYGGKDGTEGTYRKFKVLLRYLQNHVENAPFNHRQLSRELEMEIGVINEFFDTIKRTFALMNALDHKRKVKQLLGSSLVPDKYGGYRIKSGGTIDPGTPIELNIRPEIIKKLDLLHMISRKKPISSLVLKKHEALASLHKRYSFFFKESDRGYRISEIGTRLLTEYRSYKKLNTKPEEIRCGNIVFHLK